MTLRSKVAWDLAPLGREHDAVLARRLGVSEALVQRARTRRGIPPLGRNRARRLVARLLWAKRSWWSLAEIAAAAGFHRVSVRVEVRALEAAGLAWVAGGGRGRTLRVMWRPEDDRDPA